MNTLDTPHMIKLIHFNVYTNIRSTTSQTLNRIWRRVIQHLPTPAQSGYKQTKMKMWAMMSKMMFKSNLWKRQNSLFSISCKEKSFRADTFSVYLQTSKCIYFITDGFCAFTGTLSLLPVRFHEISSEALPLNIIDRDVMYENTDAWSDNSGDVQNQCEKKKTFTCFKEENFYTWKASKSLWYPL